VGPLGAAVLGLALTAIGGCNYLGAAFVLAHGPEKIPAAFQLDPDKKTVILIDDLSNRVPRRSLRDDMGEAADAAMLANKVIKQGNLISSVSARRAASGDTSEERQSAVDIGRTVGAQVVVYVTMTGWTLNQDPGFISPAAGAQVRVLDAVDNARIWPEGDKTYPFVVRMQRESGEIGTSLANKSKWERKLADKFGDELAKLFYKHEKESLSHQMHGGLN
jgi:hypothetical protein